MLSRYLDTVGNGSGTKNANGNYSGAGLGETIFKIQPAAGSVYRIARVIISIRDASGFQAEEYGNLAAALSTGIEVRVQNDSGTLIDLTDGIPITTNAAWGELCYDVDLKTWGNGDEFLLVRWTFSRSGTTPQLVGDRNERLEFVLNDDLSGLVSHYFLAQGYVEK